MPTAARLVAAVIFALAGFLAAEAYKPLMEEGTNFYAFSPLTGLIGALTGWVVMGGLAGRGYVAAAGFGLRTMVTVVFWALVAFCIYDMVLLSLKMRYDGPMEAVVGIFELMVERVLLMRDANFLVTLVVCGFIGGMVTEYAGRRWR